MNIRHAIFLSVFFLLYFGSNYFVYRFIKKIIPKNKTILNIFRVSIIFFAVSYAAARLTRNFGYSDIYRFLIICGSLWIAFLFHLLIGATISAIADFIIKKTEKSHLHQFNVMFTGFWVILTIVVTAAGYKIANSPVVVPYNITIPKTAAISSLKIAMVSDIHMGELITKKDVDKMTEHLNSLNPDVVFIIGDLFDERLDRVLREDYCSSFNNLKTKYGTYFAFGNHEYFSDPERIADYLVTKGVVVLRDDTITLADSIYIIGRDDYSKGRWSDERLEVPALLKNCDPEKPVIMLAHQPIKLDEVYNHNVDIHLSGHTHNGQLWPFNYLIDIIYTIGYGHEKINNTHFVVSCGYGEWGPPVRTSSFPEIVLLNIQFVGK